MIQSPLYAVLLAAFVAQPALSRALSEIDDSASTLSTKGVSNVSFPVFHIPLLLQLRMSGCMLPNSIIALMIWGRRHLQELPRIIDPPALPFFVSPISLHGHLLTATSWGGM
jgi:hypothetical protein